MTAAERVRDSDAVYAIAHFLLWFDRNLFTTPEDAAASLLRRLANEGYTVVRAEPAAPPDAAPPEVA
jgi:hypothetical protein